MKKLTCFARPEKFKLRMLMMGLGVITQALGLSLLIRIALGTDPCTSLTQGVLRFIPMDFGTAQLICHLINFAIVIIFDMSYIGFGTIGNMVCLGYIATFFGWIWDKVLPAGFFDSNIAKYGLLLPVLAIFILGASAYMTAGLGSSPYDAVPFIISAHVKKVSFKVVRMIWDISYMVVGFILGGNVGVMTVVMAFFLGPVINWMGGVLQKILKEEKKTV